ncbi:MAG: CHRD domain-containing protein [Rhodothermales bacterium]
MLVGAVPAMSQVAVTVGDVTGRPGETATVAVDISGAEGETAIQSFGFTVTTGPDISFTGISTDGTLSGNAGFATGANTVNGNVGGFSQGTDVTTSGTLIYLTFDLGTTGSGTFSLGGFAFNGGDPAATGSFSAGYTVSNRIIAVDNAFAGVSQDFLINISLEDALVAGDGVVSFNFDLNYDASLMSINSTEGVNGVVAAGITSGATVNGSAVDANTFRVAGFSGANLTGDGLFIQVAATATSTAGVANMTLTNVTFNTGTPVYASRTGVLTVNAVNFAPVFTAELTDTEILEDDFTFTFDYDATDANGDAITYALTAGPGSIDATTGVYTLDPMGNSGVHTITVSASDGVNTTSTSAELTVVRVDWLEARLAGFHEVPPAATVATGNVTVRLVADQGTMDVFGFYEGLAGTYSASHIHIGDVGVNGGVAFPLAPDVDGFFGQTIDVSAATAAQISALRNGGAYVNVHSSAYPGGEVRGQLLDAGNSAPGSAVISALSSVTITGDPSTPALTVTWLPVSDPDGDTVNYIFQMSANASFTEIIGIESFGTSNSLTATVGDLAAIYDEVAPVVEIGGQVTVFHRVISTDGSLWTAGASKSLTLTRGTVTDTENGTELPSEFTLKGNYPNPFNPSTTIQFDLPETADVTVQVMDMLGRQVMSIPSQTVEAGANRSMQLNASALSSGIYLYRVIAAGANDTRVKVGTMTLLK